MYGQLVIISKNQNRHNHRTFPIAVLLDEGLKTNVSGQYRYEAIFLDDLDNPTRLGRSKLYTEEIETFVYVLPEARTIEIYQKWSAT